MAFNHLLPITMGIQAQQVGTNKIIKHFAKILVTQFIDITNIKLYLNLSIKNFNLVVDK